MFALRNYISLLSVAAAIHPEGKGKKNKIKTQIKTEA